MRIFSFAALAAIMTANAFTSVPAGARTSSALKASQLEQLSKLTTLSIDSGDLKVIEKVVSIEMPDLVIFTGDIVTENNPKKTYNSVNHLLQKYNLKWTVVLGNHDDEHNTKREKIARLLIEYPNCLNKVSSEVG